MLSRNCELTGGESSRYEEEKRRRTEGGNVEQRSAICALHLFLNESRDIREGRGEEGGTTEGEKNTETIELMSQQM